jgi:hypothetical protein
MNKVTHIGTKTNDSTSYTPEQMLESAMEDIKKEGSANKAILITLDDTDNQYNTHFWNAGMSATQIIALLEVSKVKMLQLMEID